MLTLSSFGVPEVLRDWKVRAFCSFTLHGSFPITLARARGSARYQAAALQRTSLTLNVLDTDSPTTRLPGLPGAVAQSSRSPPWQFYLRHRSAAEPLRSSDR